MVLRYRFHKEKLKDGSIVFRPKVLVEISSGNIRLPFHIAALLDSGCDVTVIPEEFAQMLELKKLGETELVAYREKTDVWVSKVDIAFLSKVDRENVKINDIPVFITPKDEQEFSTEVVIGVRGIFDKFDIKFSLSKNRIELKKTDILRRKVYY